MVYAERRTMARFSSLCTPLLWDDADIGQKEERERCDTFQTSHDPRGTGLLLRAQS